MLKSEALIKSAFSEWNLFDDFSGLGVSQKETLKIEAGFTAGELRGD